MKRLSVLFCLCSTLLLAEGPVPIKATLIHGAVAECSQNEGIELVATTAEGGSYLLIAYPDCAISRFSVKVEQNAAIKNAPSYHVVGSDLYNGIKAEIRPIIGCEASHSAEPDKCNYLISASNESIIIYLHR